MQKYILDLSLQRLSIPHPGYALLQLTDPTGAQLPPMQPGQFVQVRVDGVPSVMLRRPISIHYVDREANELWLLVHAVGAATRALAALPQGATVNTVLPLGKGFTLLPSSARPLLVGGGVGVAPLLFLGSELVCQGLRPTFLMGARSASDLLQLNEFRRWGDVLLTTEDGSAGERGFVSQHSIWTRNMAPEGQSSFVFTHICTCGPKPMMQAVARLAADRGVPCEASLENMMACGLGACLCCVEDTTEGHVCVCKEGPVFSSDKLKW